MNRWELVVTEGFSAAHSLPYHRGKCSSLHGHNYRVSVGIGAEGTLGVEAMVVDAVEARDALREVLEQVDHKNLNDLPWFQDTAPTMESVALWVYWQLVRQKKLENGGARLLWVEVSENGSSSIRYYAPERKGEER